MSPLALGLALLTTAAPGSILLGGGGDTRADAERWLEDASTTLADPGFKGLLRLPAGYPKVVRSDDVPGLKPGLYVVLFGFCAGEPAEQVLATLRHVDAGIYARPAPGAIAEGACPEVLPFPTPSWEEQVALELAGARLSAWRSVKPLSRDTALVIRLERGGVLVDAQRVPAPGDVSDAIAVTCSPTGRRGTDERSLVVEQSCQVQVRGPGAACLYGAEATFTYGLDGKGRLKRKQGGLRVGETTCGGE